MTYSANLRTLYRQNWGENNGKKNVYFGYSKECKVVVQDKYTVPIKYCTC